MRSVSTAHFTNVVASGSKWKATCGCGWYSFEKDTQGEAQSLAYAHERAYN